MKRATLDATDRFRCDECRKVFDLEQDGHADCGPGGSNWFCYRCGERLEDRAAIMEARILRKHPGVRIPETALFHLAYGS